MTRIIKEPKRIGGIKGFCRGGKFSLHLFVNDILIFYDGTKRELEKMENILDFFCSATWMVVNAEKSTISREGVEEDDL